MRPLRACFSALRIGADDAGDAALALDLDDARRSSTATSSSSGAIDTRNSLCVEAWKRSVVLTMITPRITSARMFSAVWATSVPPRTATVSRIRPMRRARTIARAGSPRRAGSVADIITPIIVAEVTSRRRTGRPGSAERTIAVHDAARKNSETTIRAQAITSQVTSEP